MLCKVLKTNPCREIGVGWLLWLLRDNFNVKAI